MGPTTYGRHDKKSKIAKCGDASFDGWSALLRKTTLAQKLESEHSALRLTPDEWQVRLFGQDAQEPEHDARDTLIETLLWQIASRALELGTNVILDFGFWTREEREDFRL